MRFLSLLGLFLLLCASARSQSLKKTDAAPDISVILPGDYADPSILKDGTNYFMTNTSTNYFPGLRLWHSRDLINWKPIGYALNKFVGEVWAPDLVKHGDTYYIYFPAYPGTNWVVTAKSPYGPWSEPIDLKVKGIDPGHVVGPDGKRYLYFNDGKVAELNPDGLSLKEAPRKVYTGWPYPADWVVECMCAESPKLHVHNGWYYLTTAQGGTSGPSTSHMVVQARAKSPMGPWENSPYNPIVHTYSPSETFWSKGHGTILQDPAGNWAVAYHGYQKDRLPHGRQVLLEPLNYTKDGWYTLKRDKKKEPAIRVVPNLTLVSDNFEAPQLHPQWQFTGLNDLKNVRLADGKLMLIASSDTMQVMHATPGQPDYEVQVELQPGPGVETGLLMYYRDNGYAGLSLKSGKLTRLGTSLKYGSPALEVPGVRFLKLRLHQYDLSMSYSTDGKNWQLYGNSMNLQGYQHNILGKFSAIKPAIYWKGNGKLTVDNFQYTPLQQ